MISVQKNFQERVDEIEAYFSFVVNVDRGDTLLIKKGEDRGPAYPSQDQGDLVRTFKATAFLLLYNLMESTVSNAIEAIFDELSKHVIPFDSCRREIRHVVLSNLKQHNVTDIIPAISCLSSDIVTKTFKKNKIVSGNVDARKVKEVANEYGFTPPSADGESLLTVKTSRNDLAHGSKSFAEVGRDYTVSELMGMKDKIIAFLNSMLMNVAAYITEKHYLAAPGRP